MACCVLTAYCMAQLIRACEYLDLDIIKIEYNAFHYGPDESISIAEKGSQLVTSKIALEGLTCAACVSSIEKAVTGLDGVERVAISLPLSRATIVHNEGKASVKIIIEAIEEKGYGATAGERSAQQNLELLQHNDEIQRLRMAFTDAALVSSTISGLEALLWFRIPLLGVQLVRLAVGALAVWIQVADARVIHHNAWRRGLTASLTMDSLVSLSLLLGIALSLFNISLFGLDTAKVYWSSVSFLATVILGGRLLDVILRKQSTMTFGQLYQLQEKSMYVTLVKSSSKPINTEQVVDAATLVPRDEIKIGAGSIIPCDCYVLQGETLVDESTMTGESNLVRKRPGDTLMSGTHNLSYEISAIVSKPQEDSALETLISNISTATESSGSNKEVDMMISRFAAVIIVLTSLCFVTTLAAAWKSMPLHLSINAACERAMAILASACPCALGLARPTAVVAGLDAAQQRGVVVKGGFDTLKSLSNLTHFVLDKTGTLTTGQLSVSGVIGNYGELHRTLICIAEQDDAQTHPVARTIFHWAFSSMTEEHRRLVSEAKVCRGTNDSGSGVACDVRLRADGRWYTVHVGNERFLKQNQIEVPHDSPTASDDEDNHTLVYVAIDRVYTGSLQLQDIVRTDAAAVVTHLKDDLGLQVAMLTGDVEREALRVSKMLDIDVLSSHSLPHEKQAFVRRMQGSSSHNRVAMMGDGLNDSPALAAADVGIALNLGSRRTGPSLAEATNSQVGDVIFTSPDLSRAPELLDIARKTVRQATWNLWWAIGYNITAVSLAMGLAEPLGLKIDAARAGTMMALSSISVMAWSMWLRRELSKVSFR